MRRSDRIAFLLLCLLFSQRVRSQVQYKAQLPSKAVQVTLGESAVPLYGPWKFTIGDSPVDPTTTQMLWAQPSFDDSKWETLDLAPANGRVDVMRVGFSGTVKGWTDRGHRGYFGYAWYRIRVRVTNNNFSSPLALSGPSYVDDAYELFTDGTLVGSFGDFRGRYPKIIASHIFQPTLESSSSCGLSVRTHRCLSCMDGTVYGRNSTRRRRYSHSTGHRHYGSGFSSKSLGLAPTIPGVRLDYGRGISLPTFSGNSLQPLKI